MRESEYKKKLMDYLRKNMGKGYDTESLRWALVDQGYSRTLIDSAIKEASSELSKARAAAQEKPLITHEIVTDEQTTQKKSSSQQGILLQKIFVQSQHPLSSQK